MPVIFPKTRKAIKPSFSGFYTDFVSIKILLVKWAGAKLNRINFLPIGGLLPKYQFLPEGEISS
jgi:hypothetical protein